jgi:hypothetical protein
MDLADLYSTLTILEAEGQRREALRILHGGRR